MQIYAVNAHLSQSGRYKQRTLAGCIVRTLGRNLINLPDCNAIKIVNLPECVRDIRQHVVIDAYMEREVGIVFALASVLASVERAEELGTGADNAPFAQSVHVIIVGVVDAIFLKVGDTLFIIVSVGTVRRTYNPKLLR